ncbi:MAG: TonB-dependent receptor plug domain-containing protein, partial [Pseudolabrys sp.]
MSRLVTLGSAVLLGSVAFESGAQAQSSSSPVQVPEIVVNAANSGTLTAATAAQIREIINRNAGSVGFVDSETLKTRYANNLRDVLKDSPGVLTQERYGQELRVAVRGSGISRSFHTRGVEILQDGMPFNFADGSGDYYQVDPLALRAAEIYKGGNGLAYGSSYLGGAINFITPTAYTAVAPHMLRIDGGSFGTGRASAQTSSIWGNVDALANLTVSHSDGYRDHARQQYEHFNGNIGYRISPDVETRFYLGAYRTDQKLPGSLTLSDALINPRMASAAAIAGDQARNVRAERIANRTTFNLGTG